MARVSDYQLREYVSQLNLEAPELCDLLEITVEDLIRKFPSKVRQNIDKLGFNDFIHTGEEDEAVSPFGEE